MNKKVLGIAVALLAVVILASSIAPALAEVTYVEICAGGRCVIEVPGQPKIWMQVQTYYRSSDHGARDRIWIGLYAPGAAAPMPVAIAMDGSDEASDFFIEVYTGLPYPVAAYRDVKRWHIQVCRIGKLIIAYWTKPIEGVLPTPLKNALKIDSWTLPPGMLILKGYGEVTTPVNSMGPLPSGYTITWEPNHYDAKGTFFCPSWRFCGSVSDAHISTRTVFTLQHS